MAQITSVTSELLQAKIRQLLPSQQGFGEDLQASNVILPVIDLTSAAEGGGVPDYMQNALAFGSQTAYSQVGAGTTTIANTAGFWRVFGNVTLTSANASHDVNFSLTDGLSTKIIWETGNLTSVGASYPWSLNVDFIVFLRSGDSLTTTCSTASYTSSVGSVRQVADVNGTLVNPSGFTPQ